MPRDWEALPDTHTKFRAYLGTRHVLQDRRGMWTNEDRELVGYADLSRGERKVRAVFWRLLARGWAPHEAVAEAIGVRAGPIPEYQTQEQFDKFWTKKRLVATAERWKTSHHCPHYAQSMVRNTQGNFLAALPDLGIQLLEIAHNKKTPPAVRINAIKLISEKCGASFEVRSDPRKSKLFELPELNVDNAQLIEKRLLEIAASEPDVAKARLIVEQMRWLLSKSMPEKYGDKIDINVNHTLDLRAALSVADDRVAGVIEARAVRLIEESEGGGVDPAQ